MNDTTRKALELARDWFDDDKNKVRVSDVLAGIDAALSAPAAPVAQPVELQRVKEAIANGGGFWAPCTGCHEYHEGYETGVFSHVFGCHLGNGCSECGGIGAIWDTTDYDAMASAMMSADSASQTAPAAPVAQPLTDEQHHRDSAELRRLDASEAALIEALEWCIEDSANAVNEHVKSYGEAYRAPQLAAMRKAVEKARAALASAKEARNVR